MLFCITLQSTQRNQIDYFLLLHDRYQIDKFLLPSNVAKYFTKSDTTFSFHTMLLSSGRYQTELESIHFFKYNKRNLAFPILMFFLLPCNVSNMSHNATKYSKNPRTILSSVCIMLRLSTIRTKQTFNL